MVVRGSGMFVPEGVVTNERLSLLMDTSDEWIRQRTGIEERRFARRGQSSSTLGAEAARRALADAGLEPGELDLIVFATMTPDHYFPGNGGLLARALGLDRRTRIDIRMQCAGFLSGLQVADAFIRSGARPPDPSRRRRVPRLALPLDRRGLGRALRRVRGPGAPEAHARGARRTATGPSSSATAPARSCSRRTTAEDGRGFLGFLMRTDGAHWDKLYVPGGGSASFPYFSPEMFADNRTVPVVEGRQVFRLATTAMPEIVREILAAPRLRASRTCRCS